ncbi:MAG: ABC transporter permease subunit [Clostridia bacterium]|nr:ABC transporter permease subunit [Clostridia bacterium]
MRAFIAFIKKEIYDSVRSGRALILIILFTIFGVMNPAIAKLTPWLLDTLSESMAESGITVSQVSVSALDSWVQFFKNIPMALIAFILIEGGIFTKEYVSGTLILSLTKGLSRSTVVLSKASLLLCEWTCLYWLCFGITYGYNAYYWDNGAAKYLVFSVFAWWLFGVLTVALTVLCSALAGSFSEVLLGTGGAVILSYVIGFIPKAKEFVPTFLTDGSSLIYGVRSAEDYAGAVVVTLSLAAILIISAFPVFNKKKL